VRSAPAFPWSSTCNDAAPLIVVVDPLWAALVVALGVALDSLFGDPPSRWHPVAWMGSLLAWGRRRWQNGSPRALVVRGAVLILVAGSLAGLGGWGIASLAREAGWPGAILEALALKIAISLHDLISRCWQVADAIERGDLAGARHLVGYHLVSRPTARLDERHVASAAVESAAENVTDAFVAPLIWYLVFGLGGAFAYRAANTADAMIGYREGALEYLGKASARLDDLLNLIPARIAAVAIVAAAALTGEDARGAWQTMGRDHGRTASPNAGWTMAAMAGALGVTLEKPGAYRLGAGPLPGPGHIGRGVRMVLVAGLGTVGMMVGLLILRSYSH
jgi:adenosylcobinamide-phosphate synthase